MIEKQFGSDKDYDAHFYDTCTNTNVMYLSNSKVLSKDNRQQTQEI